MDYNNTHRAQRAAEALEAYRGLDADEGPQLLLRDLLADLRHYADLHGLDFDTESRIAGRNYREECAEARSAR